MAFLLPIPICLILSLLWAAWVSRPRRPAPPIVSVEEYRRALDALREGCRTEPAPELADAR